MVKKKITSKVYSTHFDSKGSAKMVDVSHKKVTIRIASAEAVIAMKKDTLIKPNEFRIFYRPQNCSS